jgi:hypothetical protein
MDDVHRGRLVRVVGVLLAVLMPTVALAAPPEIVETLDTRPDRGNVKDEAFVTGPCCGIGGMNNGDLEVSFWNQPAEMTFSLAKNDVWDRRYFGDRKRVITLDDIRRVCFNGGPVGPDGEVSLPSYNLNFADSPQTLAVAYDFPCPKPVGQVIVRCPDVAGHDQYTAGNSRGGMLVAKAAKGQARAALWSLLHKTRNLMVVRGEYSGLTRPIQIQLYRHQDTTPQGTSIFALAHLGGQTGYDYSQDPDNGPLPPPQAGTDGRVFWIRQAFPAEKTFSKGFQCVLAAAIDGAAYEVKAADNVKDAGAKMIIHPVDPETLRKDVVNWNKEVRLESERMNGASSGSLATATLAGPAPSFALYVAAVTTRDAADPLVAAKEMLAQALRDGAPKIEQNNAAVTKEATRAWRLSRLPHETARTCSFADATCWHGDYHFNEASYLAEIIAGQTETVEQFLKMYEEMLPAMQRNAREVYHCNGLCFPLVHYPIKHDRVVYVSVTWEQGMENTAFMLQPFWQMYQYGQDKEFLRKRAYPMMREGARFYADYVKKGDDGYYHVIPTVSQEHWGLTESFRLNRDSVGALSFTKYQLKACIRASEILGVDVAERQRWREIVAHLAPYPTLKTKDGPVFCDVRDASRLLPYNITANLIMVLWAEDISLDSPRELLETARRSLRAIPDRVHNCRPSYLEQIALTLGVPEKPTLTPIGRVLSWPGRIHLYAGVPKGTSLKNSFDGLLAIGGFEVSAVHAGTEIRGVRIKSRIGGVCRVKSPWYPNEVKVFNLANDQVVKYSMDADTIVFDTQSGNTYALLSGPELARGGPRSRIKN